MGRPPHGGGPVFRFTPSEVVEMEACLQEHNNALPDRGLISSLAEKFSASAERAGKIVIQPKQVWNWFQNRRYAQRAKMVKASGKLNVPSQDDLVPLRNGASSVPAAPARNSSDHNQMEFEAKSSRDGAWYDVAQFISHRMLDSGDPEVCVRFTGFGIEEDEWINEGKEQALYFDARVLDAQRRRHDVRGCRCRFLVRYEHDQSEEIVPLRKICRRPETDYRLRILRSTVAQGIVEPAAVAKDSYPGNNSGDPNTASQKVHKQQKLMDVNTEKVLISPTTPKEPILLEVPGSIPAENNKSELQTPS